jgi:DNA polymerase III epsilon subunit family exonuclease
MENGEPTEHTFSAIVNPERSIPLEARRIHNICDADVANAPTIMTVLPQFLEFARGSVLVAHNAIFDMGFLEAEKEFCWGYVELPECFCTMRLSQSIFPTEFRHNLDVLCAKFSIPLPVGRHRALEDVKLTTEVLRRLIDKCKIASLDELRRRAGLRATMRQ